MLMELNEILGWVLLGLFAGLIAQRLMPGGERSGCLLTIALGIIGAFVGGWIARHVGYLPVDPPGPNMPSLRSLLTATVGAIVVLAIWKWLRR